MQRSSLLCPAGLFDLSFEGPHLCDDHVFLLLRSHHLDERNTQNGSKTERKTFFLTHLSSFKLISSFHFLSFSHILLLLSSLRRGMLRSAPVHRVGRTPLSRRSMATEAQSGLGFPPCWTPRATRNSQWLSKGCASASHRVLVSSANSGAPHMRQTLQSS